MRLFLENVGQGSFSTRVCLSTPAALAWWLSSAHPYVVCACVLACVIGFDSKCNNGLKVCFCAKGGSVFGAVLVWTISQCACTCVCVITLGLWMLAVCERVNYQSQCSRWRREGVLLMAPLIGSTLPVTWPPQQMSVTLPVTSTHASVPPTPTGHKFTNSMLHFFTFSVSMSTHSALLSQSAPITCHWKGFLVKKFTLFPERVKRILAGGWETGKAHAEDFSPALLALAVQECSWGCVEAAGGQCVTFL